MKNQDGSDVDQSVVDAFHLAYFNSGVWGRTTFLGVPVAKNPCDLWTYQEIIYETRPTLIIELGTEYGGSALWFAAMLRMGGKGLVLSVDTEMKSQQWLENVITLAGDDISPEIVNYIHAYARKGEISANTGTVSLPRVMLVLDSDHSKAHILRQLELYAELVTPGCYLVVEDTNLGHPIQVNRDARPYAGPAEALAEWLPSHPEFEVDRDREKHGLTFFPGGWLRKK